MTDPVLKSIPYKRTEATDKTIGKEKVFAVRYSTAPIGKGQRHNYELFCVARSTNEAVNKVLKEMKTGIRIESIQFKGYCDKVIDKPLN